MAARRRSLDKMSFEELLAELEKQVRSLEEGAESLDASIDTFAHSMKLAQAATEKLRCAEQQVELLIADAQGNITTEIFQEKEVQ